MPSLADARFGRPKTYLTDEHSVASWLFTTDHKRIAILYGITITIFFMIGGLAISMVRFELLTPNGTFMSDDTYNKLFTLHGVIMVWFFLIPSIPNTLGNFLLPLMIGAPDVAFPRLNLLSWYLNVLGGLLTLAALIGGGGGRRLDLLHPALVHVHPRQHRSRRNGRVHRRFRVHRVGSETSSPRCTCFACRG